jgi:hypothetical protein
MLSQADLRKINSDTELLKAVEKILHEHKKKNPYVLTPEDMVGDWDVYLEGVIMRDVFYIDLEKQMLRVYIKPLQIENGEAKYCELYGKIRLQRRLPI